MRYSLMDSKSTTIFEGEALPLIADIELFAGGGFVMNAMEYR